MREPAAWRIVSTHVPMSRGCPPGPSRHECLRYIATAENVQLFLRSPLAALCESPEQARG